MLYVFLFNKWYFDELYDFLFVRPAFWIGRFLWKKGDGMVIDGLGPDGVSARVLDAARGAVRLQSGYVYHYALAMLLGVVALATWFMASGGACEPSASQSCHLRAAGRRGADPGDAACRCGALDRAWHHHRHIRPVAVWCGCDSIRTIPASSLSRKWTGWAAAFPITWAWTGFPCCSWSSPPA